MHRSSLPNPTSDDVKLNDNALHQQICTHFKVDYLSKGPVTTTGMKGQLHLGSREKRAIPVMVILKAGAAIGGTLIKGINPLDVKRAKSF